MTSAEADDYREDEKGPERLCIVTRERRSPQMMIRFVRSPDGSAVPDLKRKLPGRGVWITAERRFVEEAAKKRLFSRGFKTETAVSPALADETEVLLVRAARESLSLANKAGLVVSGFAKVESAAAKGGMLALIEAPEGAADGRRKMRSAVRRGLREGQRTIPILDVLDSEDLGLALGRPHVIHAALLDGPASRACAERLQAVQRWRGREEPEALGPGTDPAREDDQPARTRAE
jgi:hypothetical protein